MKLNQQDTTKLGIKERCQKIRDGLVAKDASKSSLSFHAGEVMRLAAIQLSADIVGLTGKEREDFFRMMDATPGWFLCGNGSAMRQAMEAKGNGESPASYGGL